MIDNVNPYEVGSDAVKRQQILLLNQKERSRNPTENTQCVCVCMSFITLTTFIENLQKKHRNYRSIELNETQIPKKIVSSKIGFIRLEDSRIES